MTKTICLNMIVKNEKLAICRCLESVKPIISHWVIVDTGSTDGTQELICKYMKDIPGTLHERPWVDFAHNRNEAMELAKGKADYLFFIDADDIIEIEPNFIMPELLKDFYLFERITCGDRIFKTLLVNNHLDWQWVGSIHEALIKYPGRTCGIISGIRNIRNVAGDGARNRSAKTVHKDIELLLSELKKSPHNPRLLMYLGLSYQIIGNYTLAIKYFEERASCTGKYDEDVYWSLLQIAICQQLLHMPKETVIESFWKSYNFRPTRIEALYDLVKLYQAMGDFQKAYDIALLGIDLPLPNDINSVYIWIHEYGLLYEFARCAIKLEKYNVAIVALKEALSSPRLPQGKRKLLIDTLKSVVLKGLKP